MPTVTYSLDRPYSYNKGGVARPALLVTVTYATTTPAYEGYLDSGADVTIMPESIGTLAGVDLDATPSQTFSSPGGTGVGRPCQVELNVLGRAITTEVWFVGNAPVLLGLDIFANFDFGFETPVPSPATTTPPTPGHPAGRTLAEPV
jgi:hypothetical protein